LKTVCNLARLQQRRDKKGDDGDKSSDEVIVKATRSEPSEILFVVEGYNDFRALLDTGCWRSL